MNKRNVLHAHDGGSNHMLNVRLECRSPGESVERLFVSGHWEEWYRGLSKKVVVFKDSERTSCRDGIRVERFCSLSQGRPKTIQNAAMARKLSTDFLPIYTPQFQLHLISLLLIQPFQTLHTKLDYL